MNKQKLPIGIQTFSTIRDKRENYIYIDKTKIALNLINNGVYYFLSRPRRFGKSLFLDTLKNIFEAKKELFENLYIYDKYDWSKKYPVININLAKGVVQNKQELHQKFFEILQENQNRLNVKANENYSISGYFSDLILKTYQKYNQKVIILIDEYDKPILDNLTNQNLLKELRDGLRDFYSVIKGSDEYLKFVFVTGVSKFSQVSIFSNLNNLQDITLSKDYSTICGYTQMDLENSFQVHLKDVDLEKVKKWYYGYNFLGESLYNPFDILLFFSNHNEYRNYWFSTGTPTFLIDLIKENNYYIPNLESIKADDKLIGSFDIEQLKLETILFQAGYLTIKESKSIFDNIFYTLSYPNLEVKKSLNEYILEYLTNSSNSAIDLYEIFLENSMEKLKDKLFTLFASIPYSSFTKNRIFEYEGYYVSVIYSYFASLGIELIAEDITNRGRIDLTLKLPTNTIYIFEFKVVEDSNENSALAQIKEKKYYEKYLNSNIYLIGIEFSKKDRNIINFEWEKYLEDN